MNNPLQHSMISHQLERWILTRWQTDTRYYVAEIMQDLFGQWLVRRTWGGLQSRHGNSLTTLAEDYDHALQLLADVEKRRNARGYKISPTA